MNYAKIASLIGIVFVSAVVAQKSSAWFIIECEPGLTIDGYPVSPVVWYRWGSREGFSYNYIDTFANVTIPLNPQTYTFDGTRQMGGLNGLYHFLVPGGAGKWLVDATGTTQPRGTSDFCSGVQNL